MHEVGVAEEVLKTVLSIAKENNASKVTEVVLKLGSISGVSADALQFAFDAIKEGSIAEGAKFQIDIIKAVGVCADCGKESIPDTFFSICDHCGAPTLEIVAGKEFEIDYIDVE
ncbi:MAG: hydrogenase maturation nickel metallochaperone HypA [Deferribacteraceae bacterium]|nr:hydrogenase maturation nickel metallochaperone HypA [Deferribacteraceae bacterium]